MSDAVSPGGFSVKITGGTVMTDGESYGGGTIGAWHTEEDCATITVSGGSIHADRFVDPQFGRDITNEVGELVHRVRVRRPLEYGEAPAAVTVTGLPENYAVNDIVEAKEKVSYHVYNGVVAFWLPDGTYFFTLTRVVDGQEVSLNYWAEVKGENVEAKLGWETGVTINGKDVSDTTGDDGWTFENGIVTIAKDGDYTISGTNTERIARLVVEADAKVTLDNLNLTTEFSPIEVHRGYTAKFEVKGACELKTGVDCSVIRVEEGSVLSFDSREAGNKLSLTVTGLKDAAAIGGRTDENVGTVWICAGTIEANGGFRSGNSYLHRMTLPGEWSDGEVVTIDGYGGNSLVASGKQITLWLPEGVSTIRLGGQGSQGYKITVPSTGEPVVEEICWYGIRVNDKDLGALADDGWRFDDTDKVLTLKGEGPFVLSGKCQSFNVCVIQSASAEVTFDNLTLESRSSEHAPYQVGTEESAEGSVHAAIRPRGINQLTSPASSGKPNLTAETTVMLDRRHAFGEIEVSGGKQVVFKLTNDVALAIGTAVSADCRVNLALPKAKVIKKIVLGQGRYDGTWAIAFDLDEEKMPEGRKIADTLAAFATGENGLVSLAGATEMKSVTIPMSAATSGLYYSLLVSPDLGFSEPTETAHVLATGTGDLTLSVAPAADPSAPRFFRMKASLQ